MKQTIARQNGKEMEKGPKGYIHLQVLSLYSLEKKIKNGSQETLHSWTRRLCVGVSDSAS